MALPCDGSRVRLLRAVVELLVMRTSSTTEIAFVLLKLFRVSSGMADKSLPESYTVRRYGTTEDA